MNYLTDVDLLTFMQKCARALKDPATGLIYIKENMLKGGATGEFNFDSGDSSVTRSETIFREIFAKANLEILDEDKQKQFPKGMLVSCRVFLSKSR